MKAQIQFRDHRLAFDLNQGESLARPLDFDSTFAQFGAPPPSRAPLKAGSFLGDTRQGGGCNVDVLQFVPHCHGTHTETIGHIVDERVTITDLTIPKWMLCAIVSATPVDSGESDDEYTPEPVAGDLLITRRALTVAWEAVRSASHDSVVDAFESATNRAMIIRNHPVEGSTDALPPYFSTSAIRWCNALKIDHLLVELPSIDRLQDDGLLTNHHVYWGVLEGTHALHEQSMQHKTITELIAASTCADGMYLLNLQVPNFQIDAAPSQPVIFPLLGDP